MSKFYGKIGYAVPVNTAPGVWEDRMVVKEYCGDLIRSSSRNQPSGNLNDDITIANEISILCDPFARVNFHCIKYIEYMGSKWKVSSVEVQYPRLILSIGGVYNESTT